MSQVKSLDCVEKHHRRSIIYNTFPKDQTVKERCLILINNLPNQIRESGTESGELLTTLKRHVYTCKVQTESVAEKIAPRAVSKETNNVKHVKRDNKLNNKYNRIRPVTAIKLMLKDIASTKIIPHVQKTNIQFLE